MSWLDRKDMKWLADQTPKGQEGGPTCACNGCDNPVDGRFEDTHGYLCSFHLEFCGEDFDPRRT